MENASKALLMAAGVLIGILVLSLAVYLFTTFGATSVELRKENETNKIAQFNEQFYRYSGREDLTIYDIITVANLATENNVYYEFAKTKATGKDRYISVYIESTNIEYGYGSSSSAMNDEYNRLITKNLGEMGESLNTYTCSNLLTSQTTQRVYQINFTKNS